MNDGMSYELRDGRWVEATYIPFYTGPIGRILGFIKRLFCKQEEA